MVAVATEPAAVPDDPLELVPAGSVVAVAMSGGVDSSVAAARCTARGLEVIGITLAMWPRGREQLRDRGCCSIDAVEDARRVANRLGIRHFTWNLEAEFRDQVVAGFEAEYAAGRTPNPCVRCNQQIKFGVLLDRARAVGATHVATGHYARIGRRAGRWTLHRSRDPRKDQAYTLHRLDQDQLGQSVFPLGAIQSKADVRAEAAALGLVTAAKAESQELCFVEGDLVSDLSRRLAGRFAPGPILDRAGRTVGRHRGLPFYTVGQRSRLDLTPERPDTEPSYVLELDPAGNSLVVGPAEALDRTWLAADDCRWVAGQAPPPGVECEVQLRAHGSSHAAEIAAIEMDRVELRCQAPVRQVSPGQAAVLYQGSEVIGGGTVRSSA